ncbi:putative zinc-binding oxidoreductase [Biscogniauxia marginata]|nr:putative zinc-binding oxidoreductase [Biscogniauxia marginata]
MTSPLPKTFDVVRFQDLPMPRPQPRMFTRQGHLPGIEFPRDGYPSPVVNKSTNYPIGVWVATCVGGLGRQIPGLYAEYAHTAYTTWSSLALATDLDLKQTESLRVRRATSSIGLCALQLARKIGASRIGATIRNAERKNLLREHGADEVFVDGGEVAKEVAQNARGGFDRVLELNGTTDLRGAVKCLGPKGMWELDMLSPMEDLPSRTRLLQDVEEGRVNTPVREFKLEEIHKIREILESGGGSAETVVVVAGE